LANSVTAASKVSLEAATSVVAAVVVVVVVLAGGVVAALVAAEVVVVLEVALVAAAPLAAAAVLVALEVADAGPVDCPSPSAAKADIMAVTSELVLKPDWFSCPCLCSTGL
jgi:hypothetical protein